MPGMTCSLDLGPRHSSRLPLRAGLHEPIHGLPPAGALPDGHWSEMSNRRAMTSDRDGFAALHLPQKLGQMRLGIGCSHLAHDELTNWLL